MTSAEHCRWAGRPMRETVRTVAAEYRCGNRIRLRACPDPGTIAEVRCRDGRIQYRADWDLTPWDLGWYDENAIQRLGGYGD